jgi:hypothetical protein
MPRTKGSAVTAFAIRQLQLQTGSVLTKLRKDIRAKEIELARLKRDEASLGRLAGRGSASGGAARGPRSAGGHALDRCWTGQAQDSRALREGLTLTARAESALRPAFLRCSIEASARSSKGLVDEGAL